MESPVDADRTGTLLVLVSAVGFATLAIFGKFAYAAGLSLSTVLAFRFLLATVIVWPVLVLSGSFVRLRGLTLAVALGLGAFGYAAMSGLYFWGLTFMSAGLVAIVLYTYPVFVVVLSIITLDERVTRRTAFAVALSLAGVALIAGTDPAGADPRGIAIVLGAALILATYFTVSRATLATVDARTLTAYVMPAATVAYFGYGTAAGTLQLPGGGYQWGVVIAIAVVATAIPIFALFAGLARIGASRAAVVSTVEPAVTVLLGAALLEEPITVATVAGGAAILAAVVLVQRA
jgi:drug/metabolite transporter (DMT)-like permease